MEQSKHFLIIDGYPKAARIDFEKAGMSLAYDLYANMLLKYLPEATYDILLPSDDETVMPSMADLEKYAGILWTGCSLCVLDTHIPAVQSQIDLAKQAYEIGIPSYGSCWGLQISVVAAGGEVAPNPKGREMGIAHKIRLLGNAENHPMFQGKPQVFEAFISHDDMVTKIPQGAELLAGNDFTSVQALSVTHQKGTFWSVQYHPEYDLNEMACLILAREEKLTKAGFFTKHEDMVQLVEKMKQLSLAPHRKDLRWQLSIDDDVLSDEIRQCEFKNWIDKLVLPHLQGN